MNVYLPLTLAVHATLPRYQSEKASGMDLCAFDAFSIAPHGVAVAQTGVRVAIPDGYEGQVRSRSGLAAKHGVFVLNSPGTIDSDYRGEIMVILANISGQCVDFKRGDRIAQLVICPVTRVMTTIVEELPKTVRGEGGLGSTGTG